MGKFLNGLVVGIGVGLFIAPQTGEETRRMIGECVAALRKSTSSEADHHFPVDAYPPQIITAPAPPIQPTTMPSSEPEEQEAIGVSPVQPMTAPPSEPEEQEAISLAAAQPMTVSSSELEEQETIGVSPAQPTTAPPSEPEEQGAIGPSLPETPPTFGKQNIHVTGNSNAIVDTAQMSGTVASPPSIPGAHPDQSTSMETSRTDTESTEKLPALSSQPNVPGRTTKRKASTRTSGTGKTRGHSRS